MWVNRGQLHPILGFIIYSHGRALKEGIKEHNSSNGVFTPRVKQTMFCVLRLHKLKGLYVTSYTYKSYRVGVPCALACGYASAQTPTQTTRKHQNCKVISSEASLAKQCWLFLLRPPQPRSEDAGETVTFVSRAGVSALLQPAPAVCSCLLAHRARSHPLGSLQLHVHTAEELV